VRHRSAYPHGVEKTLDVRLARGRYAVPGQEFDGDSNGRMQLWIRTVDPQPVTAELLAVMGDFISMGSNHALTRYCTGNSLDNTVRFIAVEDTDWVLCDIHIEAIASGFIHGSMYMFSEAGVLMAIASTSLILRLLDSD
jgi:acyl-CoA thioesterase